MWYRVPPCSGSLKDLCALSGSRFKTPRDLCACLASAKRESRSPYSYHNPAVGSTRVAGRAGVLQLPHGGGAPGLLDPQHGSGIDARGANDCGERSGKGSTADDQDGNERHAGIG